MSREKYIEIAGEGLRMRYTVNSLCAVEERAGRPLDELLDRQFSAARLLLWGGLIEARPEMTVCQAGELIDRHIAQGGGLEEIVDICAEGLREAGFFGRTAAGRPPEDPAC